MKTNRILALAALAAVSAVATSVLAQDKPVAPQKSPAVDELECRTLLRLGGEERGYTIVYLHGYVSGRKGQVKLPAQELAEATDRIVDQCIEKPGEKLLAVFERVRGK